MHNSLGWTHQLVAPSLTLPAFVLHASCFAILKQQYAARTHLPSDAIIVSQIQDRVRPISAHPGQLPLDPSWSDAYNDATTGKGPAQVYIPDGWRPDVWELTEDPSIESRASDMDFLLQDPLLERGSNYRRVRQSARSLIESILGLNQRAYRKQEEGIFKSVL